MPNRITSMYMVKLEVHLDYLHVSLQICRSESHFIRSTDKAKQNACKGSYDGHLLLEKQSRVIFERFGSNVGGIKCEQIRNTRKNVKADWRDGSAGYVAGNQAWCPHNGGRK